MKNIVMLSLVFCVAQNYAAADAEKPQFIGVACKSRMIALKKDVVNTHYGDDYVCAVAYTLENKLLTQHELQGLADTVFLAHSGREHLMEKSLSDAKKQVNFLWHVLTLRKRNSHLSLWAKDEGGSSSWTSLVVSADGMFDKITRETKDGILCGTHSSIAHCDGKSLDDLAQEALTELTGEDGIVVIADGANWARH